MDEKSSIFFLQKNQKLCRRNRSTGYLGRWPFGHLQKKFAPSTFEFGTLSTMEGRLLLSPVPMLRVEKDGKSEGILLVGAGKKGAEFTLQEIEEKEKLELEGKMVSLKGTKYTTMAKLPLELSQGVKSFIGVEGEAITAKLQRKEFGRQS